MIESRSFLRNPQLDGSSFFWQRGDVAILCLHGFTATTVEVRKIASYLSDQGYTTCGPLLPGHGSTPQELNRTGWKDWLACAENSLQELIGQYHQIFIIGESMGGLLTLNLAARYPFIRGAIVAAPALKYHNLWLAKLCWPFIPYLKKGNPVDSIPTQSYTINPIKAASSLYDFQRVVKKVLPQVNVPLLFFQGKKDDTIDQSGTVYCYEHAGSKDKELIFLEESAHIIFLDQELPLVEQKSQKFIEAHL